MSECAMNRCREPSVAVPLQVDLPYVGCFELPLCSMHLLEFDGGCAALTEELDEVSFWWQSESRIEMGVVE